MNYEQAIRATIITLDDMIEYCLNPAYQQNKTGRLDTGVYWHALSPIDRGFQRRKYNVQGSNANHVETQIIEQPIQLTCYVSEPMSERMTAFDVANNVRAVVNSLPFIESLMKQSISSTRAEQLRSIKIVNEHDNYEDEVSFRFSIIFEHSYKPSTRATNKKVVSLNLV